MEEVGKKDGLDRRNIFMDDKDEAYFIEIILIGKLKIGRDRDGNEFQEKEIGRTTIF